MLNLVVRTAACSTSKLLLESWIIFEGAPNRHKILQTDDTYANCGCRNQPHFVDVMKAIYKVATRMHATSIEIDLESAS